MKRRSCNAGLRSNPVIDVLQYMAFHGVEPGSIEDRRTWVPGGMVLLGDAIDVGYRAKDRTSTKGPGPYVHDFGGGVKVYRRARPGEKPTRTWSNFPKTLMVLGTALGFTYRDAHGASREVKGRGRLMVTPTRRTLAIVDGSGVKYVIEGGNMHVQDWIRG